MPPNKHTHECNPIVIPKAMGRHVQKLSTIRQETHQNARRGRFTRRQPSEPLRKRPHEARCVGAPARCISQSLKNSRTRMRRCFANCCILRKRPRAIRPSPAARASFFPSLSTISPTLSHAWRSNPELWYQTPGRKQLHINATDNSTECADRLN